MGQERGHKKGPQKGATRRATKRGATKEGPGERLQEGPKKRGY